MKDTAVKFENTVALLAMAGIIVLPLGEIVLRKWFATGIPGAAPFAQSFAEDFKKRGGLDRGR